MTSRKTLVERIAAGMALVFLAAAVVLLLAGAVRNWAAIVLTLIGLLIAVVAGWYAVSRHGIGRWLALAFLAGSAVPLIWGILAADLRLDRAVLTIVFGVLSVGSARVALRRGGRARTQGLRALSPAPRPSHPVLIINPKSGDGKAERFQLARECLARDIEPVMLPPGADLSRLAEDAIARGADVIGMAGGDGSQALVASIAARHHVPYVVVPSGTRNHFALDLGLDRDDVVGALEAFSDGLERHVDLAEVNGRPFINNASLGLYAKIVQAPEYREAKLRTAADMIPVLLGPEAKPFDLRFTGPDGTGYLTTHLILVSNNLYQLDHIGGRGTRKRLDGGTLGIVAARIDGPVQTRRFAALEAVGQVRRFEGWLEWEAERFRVGSSGPVEIAVDGEAATINPPLIFSSRPDALRVRIPRTAPALSPAAAAVHLTSRSTVSELVAIAMGTSHTRQKAASSAEAPRSL